MELLIIDAQGGGIGKQLAASVKKAMPRLLVTAVGTVLPPMIILTVISTFYVQFRNNQVIALLLKGMQAGVAAVMVNVTLTMCRNVLKDRELTAFLMLAGASVAAVVFQVDIILIIVVCGILGGCNTWLTARAAAPGMAAGRKCGSGAGSATDTPSAPPTTKGGHAS